MLKANTSSAALLTSEAIDTTFMGQIMTSFAKEIANKTDDIIKDAFAKNGFPINEEFIKEHIACITYEGDNFNHLWYHFGKPDALRIISIERTPDTSLFDSGDPCRMKWELRYY